MIIITTTLVERIVGYAYVSAARRREVCVSPGLTGQMCVWLDLTYQCVWNLTAS
jgi:hypothetical protein